MIISADQALTIAQRVFVSALKYDHSAMIVPWRGAILGAPVLVRTIEGSDSFWIIPVERAGQVLGTIDIDPNGLVMGTTYFYQNPDNLAVCPPFATRINAEEAQVLAGDLLAKYQEADISDPVFVHDGPRNRLAWMIEVTRVDELISRVFITPGYAYEKRIDDAPPSPALRGR